MEEKKLTYEDVPFGYELCFNDACSHRDECMHYQARLLAPASLKGGPAVYPAAWQGGSCSKYRRKGLVQMAWGFSKIYRNISKGFVSVARSRVQRYLGTSTSAYYRYHHGERLLTPAQQQDILAILSEYGSIEGIRFDHYTTSYDFT